MHTSTGNRLAELRAAADLTQAEVAERICAADPMAGVDGNTVSRWERGRVTPGVRHQRLLAEVLGVTVAELGLTQPARDTLDDLVCDLPAQDVDPRVEHSQRQWVATRRALNAHRVDLTHAAARLYPTAKLGDTGLIAGPGWIPDAPVDLAAVALSFDPNPAAPLLDGTEPQTGHVRPCQTLTRPYPRYTQAIRDLDHPRLFENRASWRLLELDWAAPSMALGPTTYFAAVDLYEATAHETALVALDDAGQPVGRPPALRDMPLRRLIGDPFDLGRRPLMPSISTLTIRAGGPPTFLLHRRDSRSVAVAGGMLHVIPSGVFQPSSVHPHALADDFDLWKSVQREFAEELLGYPEHDGDGPPVDYTRPPFAELDAARTSGALRVHCLGVALDALTLVGEILTVAVIQPETFDRMAADFVDVNDEGTVVNQRLPFTEPTISRLLASGRMAPAGAGCLELAWRHRAVLLG